MLPAISWPVVIYLILFGFARLTGGKNALCLYFYGPVPLRMRGFHSGKLWGGVSDRWWGWGPVLRF